MGHQFLFISCVLTLCVACGLVVSETVWELENGWEFTLPEPYEVLEQTDFSCLIGDPDLVEARTPHTVLILWPEQDSLSQNPRWQRLSSSGDTPIYVQEDRLAGGSGGDEFVFRAWKKAAGKLVYLEERFQSEWVDDSSFSLGKGVIRSAALRKEEE